MDVNNFLLFAFAALMLNITPGNDMIFVATNAVSKGVKSGIMAALGIFVGCLIHVFAAVIGVSAIIAQSAFLFETIKYLGAAYLIYIGVKSIFSKARKFDIQAVTDSKTDWVIFRQGVITNVLNPKVALFFLAFLPQFLPSQQISTNVSLLIFGLGLWFNVSGTMINILTALAFGKAGNFLSRYPNFGLWQERFTGAILIALGLKVAFLKR